GLLESVRVERLCPLRFSRRSDRQAVRYRREPKPVSCSRCGLRCSCGRGWVLLPGLDRQNRRGHLEVCPPRDVVRGVKRARPLQVALAQLGALLASVRPPKIQACFFLVRRWPSGIPSARAFCLRAPGVRLSALEMIWTCVLSLECCLSSLIS